MTPEKIVERINELRAERDSAFARAYALEGAIQDCEFWLEHLAAAAAPPEKEE